MSPKKVIWVSETFTFQRGMPEEGGKATTSLSIEQGVIHEDDRFHLHH
jgi:hypothetical protein